MSLRSCVLACLGLLLYGAAAGCYHATIDTGLAPSNRTVGNKWASGWVYGLVPPKLLDAGAECASGVARVETQHSFANGLVGLLTFGIYTPIEILATCAEGGGDDEDLTLLETQSEPST